MTQTPTNTTGLNHAGPHGSVDVHASRLRWVMNLRWFGAGALLLIGLALVPYSTPRFYPAWCLVGLGALLAFFNGLVALALPRYKSVQSEAALRKINGIAEATFGLDLVIWIAAMHFSGGMLSPLAGVLILICALAASLLESRRVWEVPAAASVLYLVFLAGEIGKSPDLLAPATFLSVTATPSWQMQVGAMLVGVLVCAMMGFTGYFTRAILNRLRGINRRLVEANRELSGLDLAKSRFLRVSSHQLRGPLAAIHTMISAVQEVGGFNARQYELLLKIHGRADEMMAQVDEMMLLSTIKERASETLQGQAVDVDKAVEESVQQFAPEAKEKGLTLTREGDGAAKVWAWEDAVETVLEHLLSNAVKYTPSGGSVRVRVTHQAGEVAIDVIDNGIGIPPDQQDRLFHEFFRATNARQVGGGTGLGLSIVKAIVERLGGQISVASPPGQGTSVHVSLPLAA